MSVHFTEVNYPELNYPELNYPESHTLRCHSRDVLISSDQCLINLSGLYGGGDFWQEL